MLLKTKRNPKWIDEPGTDPVKLLKIYEQICRSLGQLPHPSIEKSLRDEENTTYGKQFIVDGAMGDLGPGGSRALALALSGETFTEQKVATYKALKELRIWRSKIGDDGVVAIANFLRKAGSGTYLKFLELMEVGIEVRGAQALGRSLCIGANTSLITLNLDFNTSLGSEGLVCLCRGLMTNSSLKKLSLRHCGIDEEGGTPLCDMLMFKKLRLLHLDVAGNRLGAFGLSKLCPGLQQSARLLTLTLADNCVTSLSQADITSIKAFVKAILRNSSIHKIDIRRNFFNVDGANELLRIVAVKRIRYFHVENSDLPANVAKRLSRKSAKTKRSKKRIKK